MGMLYCIKAMARCQSRAGKLTLLSSSGDANIRVKLMVFEDYPEKKELPPLAAANNNVRN
jgi:hypothetical protein